MRKILRTIFLIGVMVVSSILLTGCGDDLILVTGVDLYTNEIHANVNDTLDLSYKVYPSNATNQKVTFWSTDENIASVDANGKVTVKANGEASIIVRSVDGGFEDYCKIVTNIDPDALSWQFGDKITEVHGEDYSGVASMALNQVTKLRVSFLQNGEESDIVTNKAVKFTSSNPTNIQVINESEGIIKACHDAIIEGDRAFSDITATLKTKNGELSTTCRVYITKCSTQDNLFVQYIEGGVNVLNERNGSETIYLTSSGDSVDFYTFISNETNEILTDYDIEITKDPDKPGETPLYSIEMLESVNGIHKFRLTPGEIEDTGALYIKTTCSDQNGKTIRATINVTVQAEIKSVKASATSRVDNVEILLGGEIFGLGLEYLDEHGEVIQGAKRDIYFDELSADTAEFVSYYGNNQFKIKKVPSNPSRLFTITGYIYVENVESSNKIEFGYVFSIRNSLESLIVSEEPKGSTIPDVGISDVTIPIGGTKNLFAYATTYDFSKTEPTSVTMTCEDEDLITSQTIGANTFIISAQSLGDTTLTFVATDGISRIEYQVRLHIVSAAAEIAFYEEYDGEFKTKLTDEIMVSGDIAKIYVKVEPKLGGIIENESNIPLESSVGTIKTVVESGRIYRYIEVDVFGLETGETLQVNVSAQRVLAEAKITIKKA